MYSCCATYLTKILFVLYFMKESIENRFSHFKILDVRQNTILNII